VQRLKTREQFQAVLAGARVSTTAHFALHRCSLIRDISNSGRSPAPVPNKRLLFALTDVWLGAMVPKRWAKRAVTRNTIKRQIYNVSSEYESALPVAAHVVRLRRGFDRAVFLSASSAALKLAVRNELEQLFSNAAQNAMAGQSSGGAR
jgi:ribonuclease P protein component